MVEGDNVQNVGGGDGNAGDGNGGVAQSGFFRTIKNVIKKHYGIIKKPYVYIPTAAVAAFVAGVLIFSGGSGKDQMTPEQTELAKNIKGRAYNALRSLNNSAKDGKIESFEHQAHRNFKETLEGMLVAKTADGKEMDSETREYLTDVIDELQNAVDFFNENGEFNYSLVIVGRRPNKRGGVETISYGERVDQRLTLKKASKSKLRGILGAEDWQYVLDNVDGGYFPLKVLATKDGKPVIVMNRKLAQTYLEITDPDVAADLAPYCGQLRRDLKYLLDDNPQTGTFWKAAVKAHCPEGAKGYKGPKMQLPATPTQPQKNYGARKK